MKSFVVTATATIVLTGCLAGSRESTSPASALAGTSWRLMHFESSDDEIGMIIPPNVQNYTLRFMSDGMLDMQLSCNHAKARWDARPSSPVGGSLAISSSAMTHAVCASNAIDVQLAQDVERVRSYTLGDGRLIFELQADAGIYVWERIP